MVYSLVLTLSVASISQGCATREESVRGGLPTSIRDNVRSPNPRVSHPSATLGVCFFSICTSQELAASSFCTPLSTGDHEPRASLVALSFSVLFACSCSLNALETNSVVHRELEQSDPLLRAGSPTTGNTLVTSYRQSDPLVCDVKKKKNPHTVVKFFSRLNNKLQSCLMKLNRKSNEDILELIENPILKANSSSTRRRSFLSNNMSH